MKNVRHGPHRIEDRRILAGFPGRIERGLLWSPIQRVATARQRHDLTPGQRNQISVRCVEYFLNISHAKLTKNKLQVRVRAKRLSREFILKHLSGGVVNFQLPVSVAHELFILGGFLTKGCDNRECKQKYR